MTNTYLLISILLMICFPVIVSAQDFPDDTLDVPFDGGLSLLIAAGIGYGLKKAHERRKAEKL